jgi:hypothetical protein
MALRIVFVCDLDCGLRQQPLIAFPATAPAAVNREPAPRPSQQIGLHLSAQQQYCQSTGMLRAGQHAVARSSHTEGIELLTAALGLLRHVRKARAYAAGAGAATRAWFSTRRSQEIIASGCWPSLRPRDLCRLIGTRPQLFAVLVGLASFYTKPRGDRQGWEFQQESLTIAERDRTRSCSLRLIAC